MSQTKMRVPPHSPEAEGGVLGAILLDMAHDSRVIDLCSSNAIEADSFFIPAHRVIYETLLEMRHANQVIDSLTLLERLRATERLEQAGGVTAIQTIIDNTPTAAHAEYYINIVRQKHLLRRVISYARDAERRCFEDVSSAELVLSEVEQRLMTLSELRQSSEVSWSGAINSAYAMVDRIFQAEAGAVNGLSTGFKNLDTQLRGLRNGEMIVLAARPSVGKTSLAMNIAECIAMGQDIYRLPMKGAEQRPRPVGIFSLEMTAEALAMRMLCGYAGVALWKVGKGLGSGREITQKLTQAASELSRAPIFIDDTSAIDIMDLRARARRMKKRHKIEFIVIDYLQLCRCREYDKQGLQVMTSQISGHIKAMAKELNLPVLVLSQLSRANERRGDKSERPKLSDLRDSGAIEQDADVVLLLRRPARIVGAPDSDDDLLAYVDVAKHRNGPTGEVKLNFDGDTTRFEDRLDSRSDMEKLEPED